MKIAGIYPLNNVVDPKIQHAVSEPYGLERILAIAKNEGHDVELFIPFDSNYEKFLKKILDFNPDIACFSAYTCQFPLAERVANELKNHNPKIINMAGNRYPTYLGGKIKYPFDIFALGEGEATFQEFLGQLKNGNKDFEKVKGLAIRIDDTKSICTEKRPRIADIDMYPNAIRNKDVLAQVYRAISIPALSANPHYAIMEYSRGCECACSFCDNAGFWRTKDINVVYRSPQKVVEEMFSIKEQTKDPIIFYFIDLNFTTNKDKTNQLLDEMIKQKLNVSWYCMSNIQTLDNENELLSKMKEAGCFKIAFGIESTNNSSLKSMNKSTNNSFLKVDKIIQVLENTAQVGILNQGFYIIGFDWETEESIWEDSHNLVNFPLHQLNVGIFTPIPLSAFYNKYISYGIETDLRKHDRNTLIFKHPNGITNTKIKDLQNKIHRRFYSSVQYKKYINDLIAKEPRFKKAFNDYFEYYEHDTRIEDYG